MCWAQEESQLGGMKTVVKKKRLKGDFKPESLSLQRVVCFRKKSNKVKQI